MDKSISDQPNHARVAKLEDAPVSEAGDANTIMEVRVLPRVPFSRERDAILADIPFSKKGFYEFESRRSYHPTWCNGKHSLA